MIVQLSEALEVPLHDRKVLLHVAGFAPYYREKKTLDDEAMAPITDALRRMLTHHAPYPAVVVDREFNLINRQQAFSIVVVVVRRSKNAVGGSLPERHCQSSAADVSPARCTPVDQEF